MPLLSYYYRLGYAVAKHPCIVVLLSILIIEQMALGLLNFSIITDPIELWYVSFCITKIH